MKRNAVISTCGKYRYVLWRTWSDTGIGGKTRCMVMLNPSTADAEIDDPTIRRCVYFANRDGFNRLSVVNLFVYRTKSPAELKKSFRAGETVIGPENLNFVKMEVRFADEVVAAWGAFRQKGLNSSLVLSTVFAANPLCFGKSKDGYPRHPLYLPNDVQLISL